jgi:hypothetical protein
MHSIRPPVMTFLGLPGGPIHSWPATGKSFVVLNAFVSAFAALSLFLLLRIGAHRWAIGGAAATLLLALGPFPAVSQTHTMATGFMADSLLSWIVLAALLLIPYEASPGSKGGDRQDLWRGILWSVVFLTGAMTKVSFFYFAGLILSVLVILRTQRGGRRSTLRTLTVLAICSVPAAAYWIRYGKIMLQNGWSASFGSDAGNYRLPLKDFGASVVHDAPGVLAPVLLVILGLIYLALSRRPIPLVNWAPPLIAFVYGVIGLASPNRELRYFFPVLIALPFLVAALFEEKSNSFPRSAAGIAAASVFAFLTLAGLPMASRPDRESIRRSEAVLGYAAATGAKRVLLATDGASLNEQLILLAMGTAPRPAGIEFTDLAYRAVYNISLEEDFKSIRSSELVVFQDMRSVNSPFTNQRVQDYETYVRQCASRPPFRLAGDVSVYDLRSNPLLRPQAHENLRHSLHL